MSAATADTVRGVARPSPVFCVTEHLRRDRRLADDACVGRFTELGQTVELGTEPDWLGASLPADEEWRIAWSKFYVGLDLAAAFRETGRRRYQLAWERLVSSWIDRVPVGDDPSDAVARRILNWIYAWNAFADAPGFAGLGPGLAARVVESIAAQIDWLRAHLTVARNHRTLELYSLFIAGLALPDVDRGRGLVRFALGELDRNLSADFRADGVHVEASTHYHLIVLRSFVGVRENATRFEIALPAGFDERLGRALDFALHARRPDGLIPALSDADTGSYAELLGLAADHLGRPDYLYAATAGARGRPPAARSMSFAAGGYHVQRSGWGEGATRYEDERFLIFDCGPLGDGGHGHYDLLSVELAAGGRPLILDPGRYTYHEGKPNLRRWFKGTAAHNTVCVDGLDQTEYRRRKPKGPIAEGRLLGRAGADGPDVLWGEALSPQYDARHRRRVIFVAGEYWAFEDRLRAERPHRYDQRWHLAPEAWEAIELSASDRGTVVRAPGLALLFAPGLDVSVEPGWYAPEYGVKLPAPVVSAVAAGAAEARLIAVAVPLAPDAAPPALSVLAAGSGAAEILVEGVGSRGEASDAIAWSDDEPQARWRRSGTGDA
ncbi:MAG TPA: alginate lyase family protein [Solirubrobacterales bacterium]|nr:alginate lyase family protein [Solirubrobacterales bacterium]